MKERSLCTTTSSALQNGDNWLQGSHRAPDPQFSPRTFLSKIVSKFILEHPAIIATTLGTPISSQGSRNGSTGHFHPKRCTSDISDTSARNSVQNCTSSKTSSIVHLNEGNNPTCSTLPSGYSMLSYKAPKWVQGIRQTPVGGRAAAPIAGELLRPVYTYGLTD